MLGLFSRCPLAVHEKVFVERGFQWLSDQFGSERLLNAEVLLPTHALFPKTVTGELEQVRELLDGLCEFLHIDSTHIELRYFEEGEPREAAAGWEKTETGSCIAIDAEKVSDPPGLAAALLHELSRELLHDKAEPPREFDRAMLTDLLMPFLGVGIFAANSTVAAHAWHDGQAEYWQISRQGYLPARMFGYAFALFCWLREESLPTWANELRPDARNPMQKSLKFLKKSGDAVCTIQTLGKAAGTPPVHQMITDLNQGTPSRRLFALLELSPDDHPQADLAGGLSSCCRNANKHLRAQAPLSIVRYEEPAETLNQEMQELLFDNENSVRGTAAAALSSRKLSPEAVVPAMIEYLNDGSPSLRQIAAYSFRDYGPAAAPAIPALVKSMIPAIVECDNTLLQFLMETLAAISADPERDLAEELASRDEEIRRRAIDTWRDLHAPPTEPVTPEESQPA